MTGDEMAEFIADLAVKTADLHRRAALAGESPNLNRAQAFALDGFAGAIRLGVERSRQIEERGTRDERTAPSTERQPDIKNLRSLKEQP
jgi:hypothetical protein